MSGKIKPPIIYAFCVSIVVLASAAVLLFDHSSVSEAFLNVASQIEQKIVFVSEEEILPAHVPLPDEVRGIYVTANTAPLQRMDELVEFMIESGLNTVVIDLKTDNGELAFNALDQELAPFAQTKPLISDLDALLKKLEGFGIYRIARVPVMRDSNFAESKPESALKRAGGSFWKDNTGSFWIDPSSQDAWDYNLKIAKEAHARGFDEVQFDYVRFASDGRLSQIVYPLYDSSSETKVEVMQKYFSYTGGRMREMGIPVSFDLFGMTHHTESDFNIGQRLIDVFPNADFVSGMLYPSHYAHGFNGFSNPADHPYEIIDTALKEGAEILKAELGATDEEIKRKLRPWLQDFDLGAVYTSKLIRAQIQAARDNGASGWLMWNARNVYEEEAYLIE